MFTWVCPQCGRDVPPSYDECPDCAQKAKAAAGQAATPATGAVDAPPAPAAPPPAYAPPVYAPPASAAPPPPPPGYAPPPGGYPPPPQAQAPYPYAPYQQPPQYQQPAYMPPAPGPKGLRALPTWLMAVLFAGALLGVVFGVYSLVNSKGHGTAAAPAATVESPAAKPAAKPNPLQKYIEVSGVRFAEEKKKPVVKFVITNHSGADITGLAGNVTIWGRTQKSEEDAQGTFSFSGANIGPYETKDLTAPLTTKYKIYELPDWQNVTTDIQVTAPVESVDSGG